MGAVTETNLIETRIQEKYEQLSAQERKAAQTILENLEDLALYSSAEIANKSGVSRPTVSRLYRSLGFESFSQVKEHARSQRSRGVPVAGAPTEYSERISAEMELIQRSASLYTGADYSELVSAAVSAAKIVIIGFRNNFTLGLHLRNQLIQARDRVVMVPTAGQSLAEELAQLGPDDLVILCGVRRRTNNFRELVKACANLPGTFALLTDPSGRRYSGKADISLEIPVETSGAFDSYAAHMSFVSVFANEVLEKEEDGAAHVERVTALYESLSELEN
ncbi:MurR/RpiR family transcriptional regulator [Rothia aerolata]|uniref:RpiR family transcriptional regulator n=1 Tax=Rothia aerolata TaxID=1812262 RepID=A0A917MV13_9MICC|nr:MurR/RpiR family transcriptional regulator [Rothia aerolata]GGH65836.1 RpiR family transcriptional regulator [Rothia aerolata]